MSDIEQRAKFNPLADLSDFTPTEPKQAVVTQDKIKKIAEKHSFTNTPNSGKRSKKSRIRRTGRNTQYNLKLNPDYIERFEKIADGTIDGTKRGLGETFEALVESFEKANK